MTNQRPIQIDRRPSDDQETEQAILRVQRSLCLMNAPHSYRLFDAAALLRQAALSGTAGNDPRVTGADTAAESGACDKVAAYPRIVG
ncbi:MAG TPA: hypothetical protein VM659_11320 [Dongiaceae bacterium]|nr:hypothetical protein [Dongiaceae bacterium]